MKEVLEDQLKGKMHLTFPFPPFPLQLLPVRVHGLWCPSVIWTVSVYLHACLVSDLSISCHCLVCGGACGVPGCTLAVVISVPELSGSSWGWLLAEGLRGGFLPVWGLQWEFELYWSSNLKWHKQSEKCYSSSACHTGVLYATLLEMKKGGQLMLCLAMSCHAFSLPSSPSPAVASVMWSWTAAVSFLQVFSHTSPCTSLCAHLGLACFLSLA